MYDSRFFYENGGKFYISPTHIEKIKKLTPHVSDESGYYDTMLQWRLKDQTFKISTPDFNALYPAMQFISMVGKIKPEFQSKYQLKDYQISLLRRLYLEYDEDAITMGFKRPFGNSHVLGDVREEMIRYGDVDAKNRDNEEEGDYSVEADELSNFVSMLAKFYQEGFELPINAFVKSKMSSFTNRDITKWSNILDGKFRAHSYVYEWEPDISVYRDIKLNEILSD